MSEPDPVLVQVRQFFNSGPLVWTKPDQDKLIALVRARGWPWCDKAIAGRMSEGDGTPIQTLYKREFGKNGKASTPIALDPASSRKVKI